MHWNQPTYVDIINCVGCKFPQVSFKIHGGMTSASSLGAEAPMIWKCSGRYPNLAAYIFKHFLSNFSLSSLWSVELNQRSTLTHDTMSPCWVVQNWSCQSRGRSLKLINPSRPWCDFFLVKGWAAWQPVGWLVSLTSCSVYKSRGHCNTCKCLSQALLKRLSHCCRQICIKMISKW